MRWKTAFAAAAVIFAGCVTSGELDQVPRISKEDLKPLVEKGDVVLIDVRSRQDWSKSEYKIKGADPGRCFRRRYLDGEVLPE